MERSSSSSVPQRAWPENTSRSTEQNITGTLPSAIVCWTAPMIETFEGRDLFQIRTATVKPADLLPHNSQNYLLAAEEEGTKTQ